MQQLPISKSTVVEKITLDNFRLFFIFHSAHRSKVDNGWSYKEHKHPMFELNMVIEGTQLFTLEGRNMKMSPGDIVFIKPNETHSCQTVENEGLTYACIHFGVDEPELRQSMCRIRDSLHQRGSPLWKAVSPVLQKIGSAESEGKIQSKLSNLSLFMDLISLLSRLLSDPPPALLADRQRYDKLASLMADRITRLAVEKPETNKDILIKQGVQRIARELGYHPAYCSRVFKSTFGVTPREYLSGIKIRESKLLLMDGKLNMEQIAVRLGFRDASHFSKQFKRWTKLSPTEYRQLL